MTWGQVERLTVVVERALRVTEFVEVDARHVLMVLDALFGRRADLGQKLQTRDERVPLAAKLVHGREQRGDGGTIRAAALVVLLERLARLPVARAHEQDLAEARDRLVILVCVDHAGGGEIVVQLDEAFDLGLEEQRLRGVLDDRDGALFEVSRVLGEAGGLKLLIELFHVGLLDPSVAIGERGDGDQARGVDA